MSASSHPNGTYPPASRANSAYVSDSKADLVSMELEQGNRVNINEGQPIIPNMAFLLPLEIGCKSI